MKNRILIFGVAIAALSGCVGQQMSAPTKQAHAVAPKQMTAQVSSSQQQKSKKSSFTSELASASKSGQQDAQTTQSKDDNFSWNKPALQLKANQLWNDPGRPDLGLKDAARITDEVRRPDWETNVGGHPKSGLASFRSF